MRKLFRCSPLKCGYYAVFGLCYAMPLTECSSPVSLERMPAAALDLDTQRLKGKHRYIVTLHDDVAADEFVAERKLNSAEHFHALRSFAHDLDETEVATLIKDKRRVRFVEMDGPVSFGPVNPPLPTAIPLQNVPHGIQRMRLPQFPLAHINGVNEIKNVDVAIIDSGIDPHEDLQVYQNFAAFSSNGTDSNGHGTAVAGILAAIDNNLGVVGVASGVRIWNVKALGPPPFNTWSNVLKGINYVYQHADQISVVNMSLGNQDANAPIATLHSAIKKLVRAGVVVVAAAGNNARDLAGPDGIYDTGDDAVPAAFPEVMAVSAMDATIESGATHPNDQFWLVNPGVEGTNFSAIPRSIPTDNPDPTVVYPVSRGRAIDVAAPGVNVFTTASGVGSDGFSHNYAFQTGTSFAAPHVAGLVALYIAANGRAHDEKGVYKIRQAIIDQSEALQPQSSWASDPHDPDSNHESLAFPSEAWVPAPTLSQVVNYPVDVKLTVTTADAATCSLIPCSIPGYNYTIQMTSDLVHWTDLISIPGDGTVLQATDSDLSSSNRFYRVRTSATP